MTVQDLITELNSVPNKNLLVVASAGRPIIGVVIAHATPKHGGAPQVVILREQIPGS